jgi:L-2-hydroxyglutarate oxidase LhgO
MDRVDVVVIGAGVVGLAVARALALQGREVMLLEAADAIGTGTSSRNSEVIHAGLYYPQGSLKARLCVQGRDQLYAYCSERGIGHQRCGKLIVATSEAQVAYLHGIMAQGVANGVSDLSLISGEQARVIESRLACVAAVQSPSTGIVDSHALMLALLGDLEHAGGLLALKSAINRVFPSVNRAHAAMVVVADDGTELAATSVVNAAGLQAPALARRFEGLDPGQVPPAYFAKGSYFTLSGRSPFGRLIYPVPEAAGLGVHLTIDLGGQAKFGPDVQWVESADDLVVDPARGPRARNSAPCRSAWPARGGRRVRRCGVRPTTPRARRC